MDKDIDHEGQLQQVQHAACHAIRHATQSSPAYDPGVGSQTKDDDTWTYTHGFRRMRPTRNIRAVVVESSDVAAEVLN